MKAVLSNKIYLTDLTPTQTRAVVKSLTFTNPKHQEALRQGRTPFGIDRTISLYQDTDNGLALPRGVALPAGIAQLIDERTLHLVSITSSIVPRSYQERVIRLAINAGGGVIVAPTGSGKTTMSIEIAARLKQRCLILVKSLDLAKQWQGAIERFTGLTAGLIGGGQWLEGNEFTVGLVQTLVKHEASLDYGLVIVDECHNTPARQAYEVINHQTARYRFGLSATPQRRDSLEFMIHSALGEIVAEVEAHEVNDAVLPVTVSTLQHNFIGNPESWSDFINLLARDDERNRKIVASAIKSSRSVGTAVLTATVEHAETLCQLIQLHGVEALLLHGQLGKKERERRMLNAPASPLIVGTLSLLSEGIDWPHVGAIIFASPVSAAIDRETPAATRLIQTIGRGRRPYPGRTRAYVLDIVDNHPLGQSAFKKRREIYRREGFKVC